MEPQILFGESVARWVVFTSILCPIDFSSASSRALHHAISLANLTRAKLTLLHVTDPLLEAAADAAGSANVIVEQTEQELRKLMADVNPAGTTGPIDFVVAVGQPAKEILQHAGTSGADLIVMGTQGRGAGSRFLMGSTTKRVLQGEKMPVLVVPPRQ